jgi:hypothetical protein
MPAIREYFRMTRPLTDVPFHSPSSHFYQTSELALWPTDVYTQDPSIPVSKIHAYYLENYHKDCLPVEGSGYLSDDGLTVTYTVIYKSKEIMNKMINDPWFSSERESRLKYYKENDIIITDEFFPIED